MQRHKILVAARDPRLRRDLRGFFEHHGQFVECAGNACDAIRTGLKLRPALLVTELELEDDTSGLDVMQSLRRKLEDLHILAVTTEDPGEVRTRWPEHLPVSEFSSKPLRPTRLLELLEQL